MSFSKIVPGLSLFAVLLAAPSARAQACAADADCPGGTTCQLLPTPSVAPDCGGPDCPVKADGGTASPAAPSKACAPAPCQVDSDCGGQGRLCQHDVVTVCNGGTVPACARGQECDTAAKPEAASCVERTVSACVYRWQLPCNADADCGDGFTCAPNISGMCSGGAPTSGRADAGTSGSVDGAATRPTPVAASGSGEATDLPAPAPNSGTDGGAAPVCTTTESFPGYCRAKATTCATDADCPASWSCATGAIDPTGPATGTGTGGSSGSGVASDAAKRAAAETSASPPADLVATVKTCQAPAAFPARGVYATDATGGSTTGGKLPPSGTPTGPGATNGESASSTGNAGCAVGGGTSLPTSLAGLAGLGFAVATIARRLRRRR